jgi:uncharacterized repeat protein (TIGR03803 family)
MDSAYNDFNDTNADGADVRCTLLLSGDTLYGVAPDGGPTANGTIFSIRTNGTAFTVLYAFISPNLFSANPTDGLVGSGNTLFGTTLNGGDNGSGSGSVFALTLGAPPVLLSIEHLGNSAVLNWNAPGFFLQTAPVVNGTYTNIPGATSPYTNPITAPQQYFRLSSN